MRGAALVSAVVCSLLLSAAVAAAPPALASGSSASTLVSTTTMTFVDTSRSTPPWNGMPARPSRTLVTSIWYPAKSGSANHPGPYPLIVFAHGLGGSPQDYRTLLTAWAAAGYVVAAPLFPLSSSETPGGPDGGDIGNQPGDMSFVIDQMLKASAPRTDLCRDSSNPTRSAPRAIPTVRSPHWAWWPTPVVVTRGSRRRS